MANEVNTQVLFKNVMAMAAQTNTSLNQSEQTYAMNIITAARKQLAKDNLTFDNCDVFGCALPSQIKRFCRLGLSLEESEIYLDVRNAKNQTLKDINLKMQYQGEKKLLFKFCQKGGGIDSFYEDVVMSGEKVDITRDLRTGQMRVADHQIPDPFNRNCNWENKDNVKGAYAIAYHKDGSQTFVMIDKERINRAINASASREKDIYKKDYKRMVIKTAVHDLFKALKVYNVIPDDLNRDYVEVQMSNDELKKEVKENANKDYIDAEVTEKKDPEQIAAQSETLQKQPKFDEKTGEVLEPVNLAKTSEGKENSTEMPQGDGYGW